MPVELDELAEMTTSLMRERNLSGAVVGVTHGAEGCYAEVVVALGESDANPRHVLIGVQRDDSRDRVRAVIETALAEAPGSGQRREGTK